MAPELKKIPRLSKESVEKLMTKFANMDRIEIQELMKDPKATMMELMVGSVILKAYKDGDQSRINWILDRTIGKVKEQKEIILPMPTIIERPSGEVIELGAELLTEGDDENNS